MASAGATRNTGAAKQYGRCWDQERVSKRTKQRLPPQDKERSTATRPDHSIRIIRQMAQIRACEVKIRLQQLKSDRWPFFQSGPLLESRLFIVSGLVEPFYFGKPDHSFVWSFWNCVNPGIDTWKPGHSLSSDLSPPRGEEEPSARLVVWPLNPSLDHSIVSGPCAFVVLAWSWMCMYWVRATYIYFYGYILYRYVYMYILYINGL